MPVSGDVTTQSRPLPRRRATSLGARYSKWWRQGRAHIDESEIWLMRNHSTSVYERLTEGGAKQMWPMWSADGRTLFYMSDRGGAENLWALGLGGKPRQLTKFTDGRVLWPSISADGKLIVFERGFGVWKLDTSSGRAEEVRIARRGAAAGPSVERLRLADQFQELALAPDGKKVAFVVRGEVFAASATDGGDAARVTVTPGPESQPAWAPDSRRLVYVSERNGAAQIFLYDFGTNAETRAMLGWATRRLFPPDEVARFWRGGRELRGLNVESSRSRVGDAILSGRRSIPTPVVCRPTALRSAHMDRASVPQLPRRARRGGAPRSPSLPPTPAPTPSR